MIVLDTSFWIGILIKSDFHHMSSRVWYGRWTTNPTPIHLPAICLPEVAGVLGRGGEPPAAVLQLIDSLKTRQEINFHSMDAEFTRFSAEVAVLSRLKGANATFVALAASLDIPLLTWDKEQGERGARFCRTMTPVEAMEIAE